MKKVTKKDNSLNLLTIIKTPVEKLTVEQHKALHTAAKAIAKLHKESTAFLKKKLDGGETIKGITYTASRNVRAWKSSVKLILPKLVKAGLTDIVVIDRKKLEKEIPDYYERDDIFEFKVHSAHKLEKDYDISNLEKHIEKVPTGKSLKFVEEIK